MIAFVKHSLQSFIVKSILGEVIYDGETLFAVPDAIQKVKLKLLTNDESFRDQDMSFG